MPEIPTKRFVPAIAGSIALVAAVAILFAFHGWWRYLLVVPLLAFGWMSVKTALFASDDDIRELTGSTPLSKGAKDRFMDRL
jgi:uncharacterized membrane protein